LRQRESQVAQGDAHSIRASAELLLRLGEEMQQQPERFADASAFQEQLSTLANALRSEQRQRLEAEELYHQLTLQHQRNVQLLEQRLQLPRRCLNRPGGSSPAGTPRTPQRAPDVSLPSPVNRRCSPDGLIRSSPGALGADAEGDHPTCRDGKEAEQSPLPGSEPISFHGELDRLETQLRSVAAELD
jgi:hypothetical protein